MGGALASRARLGLALFALLAWFATLDYRSLVKPDEGRYAEIPREMLASGDWLTPRLNGVKYFEKPPLQYWATAAAYELFGLHEWTARLWTALSGFLTVVLVWWAGRRLFGPAAGDFAAMVLASSAYFVLLGHVNALDMGLTLFTTVVLAAFCLALTARTRWRAWMMLAWAAMALAVLSKGLIGVVLPAATLVVYSVLARDRAVWRRLCLLPGALVFLAIAAPWYVAVSVVNPEFPRFFFLEQHVLRYATDAGRREGPFYYFAVVLLAGMLPWTLVLLEALWNRAKAGRAATRPELALAAWIAVIFVFFTLSRSKLPAYVLPMVPALALLMGERLARLDAAAVNRLVLPVGVLALAALPLVAYAPQLAADPVLRPLMERYSAWLYAALAVLVAGMLLAWRLAAARGKPAAIAAVSASALLASLLALNGHDSFAPSLSSRELAMQLRGIVPPQAPFYSVRTYDQTLPFYLERTFTLVEFRDELDYGLLQEPQLAIGEYADFRARWAAHGQAYAITTPEHYEAMRRDGLSMEVVAADARRIVVRKPQRQ